MKPLFLATVAGVLLAAPFHAQAEQSARPSNPLDPDAPVPALAHDSALRGHLRPGADAGATPDKTWRRANDVVAGHAGGEGQQAHGHHHPAPGRQ
jgi:hypothetical protein